MQTYHLILLWRLHLVIVNKRKKKKRTYWKVNFAIPADHRVKLKEGEKRDEYVNLDRELKKLWNMKLIVMPLVLDTLGAISKGLVKGLGNLETWGQVQTTQATGSLRSARILRRVLEIWGDLLSRKLQWKPSANVGVKNSERSKMKEIICRPRWPQSKQSKKTKGVTSTETLSENYKKTMEHEGDGYINCTWHVRNDTDRIDMGTGWVTKRRTSTDYPN